MTWQHLTPQLRTRLNRLERLVGLFVSVALALLLFALVYYLYQTAKRKGWFLIQAPYFTFVDNAAGLKVGDPVRLMGFDVGHITEITAMPPFDLWNVYVAFTIREPYYGYLWNFSRTRLAAGDFLGNRGLEVTKGTNGYPSYLFHELRELSMDEALNLPQPHDWRFNFDIQDPDSTNFLIRVYDRITPTLLEPLVQLGTNSILAFNAADVRKRITGIFDDKHGRYIRVERHSKGYFLPSDESPALSERLDQVVRTVEHALPNFLNLTNQLELALGRIANAASEASVLLTNAQPVATNLASITAHLRDPNGSLGQWLLPTSLLSRAETTLDTLQHTTRTAQETLHSSQTNITQITTNLVASLQYLSLITSNLNAQVQNNHFILSDLSDLVRNTDDMVQGLKRHWLLRSSFPTESPSGADPPLQPTLAPPP